MGNSPLLLLHNVCDAYALTWKIHDREFSRPSAWMSGRGTQTYEYALLAHAEEWEAAEVPQWAWEYNTPVIVQPGLSAPAAQFCETSSNVIVEAFRRVDDEIEVRLVECLGQGGKGRHPVQLPHTAASEPMCAAEPRGAAGRSRLRTRSATAGNRDCG